MERHEIVAMLKEELRIKLHIDRSDYICDCENYLYVDLLLDGVVIDSDRIPLASLKED